MTNILWKKPDESLAFTFIAFNTIDPIEHANELLSRGDIPSDWSIAATNVEQIPDWKLEDWRYVGNSIVIDFDLAKETTRERLRQERESLLLALDIEYMRNQESGIDNTAIVAEKQRLRDITLLVDACSTIDELKALHC